MANNPFDRTILNLREKPLSSDVNQAQSQLDFALREIARSILGKRASNTSDAFASSNGCVSSGMKVEPQASPNLTVIVKRGIAFMDVAADTPSGINSIVGLDDLCSYKPIMLTADFTFTVPTPPGTGNSRIDIIEARPNRLVGNANSRLVLNPTTGAFDPTTVNKTLAFVTDGSTGTVISPAASTAALSYKQGVAAATGSEVEPTVTSGYIQLARINVGPNATTISASELVDRRAILLPGGVVKFGAIWRVQWNAGSPIYTLVSMDAPPAIRLAMGSLSLRGAGTFYAVGGQIAGGEVVLRGSHPTGHDLTDRFSLDLMGSQGAGTDPLTTVDASLQTSLSTTTPAILVGVGAKVLRGRIISRFVTNTGASNNTDASLEDMHIYATGHLHY